MLTTEQLRDYLGVDSSNDEIISELLSEAIGELEEATGVDWSCSDNGTANSAIRAKVYLSFYGNRGEIKDTSHLDEFIRRRTIQLKYRPEVRGGW